MCLAFFFPGHSQLHTAQTCISSLSAAPKLQPAAMTKGSSVWIPLDSLIYETGKWQDLPLGTRGNEIKRKFWIRTHWWWVQNDRLLMTPGHLLFANAEIERPKWIISFSKAMFNNALLPIITSDCAGASRNWCSGVTQDPALTPDLELWIFHNHFQMEWKDSIRI